MNKKLTILIDLDGVLNLYEGNYDENFIPPINPDAKDFLKGLNKNFNLILFTSRNLLLASRWLINNEIDEFFDNVTNFKIPAFLQIDDRAICFEGDFNKTLDKIKNFKAWWKNS